LRTFNSASVMRITANRPQQKNAGTPVASSAGGDALGVRTAGTVRHLIPICRVDVRDHDLDRTFRHHAEMTGAVFRFIATFVALSRAV
jgi:protein tyrosine phosphatase (PTP) superfamily phosphohydrolase (DUF442 family)